MRKTAASRPASKPSRRQDTALGWLGHDHKSASVLATARAHMQVERVIATVLPPALAKVCRVARLENARVQLAVPGAAHAAKLRQMAPRVAQTLSMAGWNVNEIIVKVQAGMPGPGLGTPRPPREAQPLGAVALDAFEHLQETLRPGPLADAVARLLAHHKPR